MRYFQSLLLGLVLLVAVLPADLSAQDRRVTGVVTRAESGQPLQAAQVTVIAPGSWTPVLTSNEGRFVVNGPAGEFLIEVRAFGYATTEVLVGPDQTSVQVALTADVFQLSEVVVTGQATTIDRRSATTAVAYVAGDDVKRVPQPTILNSLAGKITGVNLQTNSGAPGGGIQMQIRGNATLLGGFDPLYVVDGVIYSNASIPSGRGFANNAANASTEADAVNRIADLNPSDIASIEVLKGAAASSIYGSKAANGVVVITTIRGQAGAPRANLTQRIGVFTPLELLESRRWTAQEAAEQWPGGESAPFFEGNSSPFFDNAAAVYDNRELSYETIADLSGGTANTRYFVSGSWKHDGGIERETFADRQSLRLNLDQTLTETFEVRLTSAYTRNANNRGWNNNCNNFGCHGYALSYIPSFVDITRRNADGSFPRPTVGPQSNPIQLTELGVNDEETNRFTGGLNADWDAYRGDRQSFRMVFGVGLDVFDQANDVWTPNELFFEQISALPGESLESGGRSRFYNWNVNGVHDFQGSGWSASTSFGLQYEDRRLETYRIRTQNLLPGQRNVDRGTNIQAVENLTEERTIALYAQESLRILDERMLVQLGLRAERSSVNGDVDKYYMFPKASASYRFIDLLGAGSEVKLRAAYGETGNQPLFGQKFTNLNTPQLGGQQGVTVSTQSGFADVEPERLQEVEAGIDGEMSDGRLTWELTGFVRNTTNLLLQRVPAPSSGFTSQIFNGGKIVNQGIEIALGYVPIMGRNVQWITRGTFTRYTSDVEDLAGLPAFFPAQSGFGNLGRTRIEEGQPITQIVGFPLLPDGTRGPALEQLGNSAPDFRMGFVNEVTYGAASLNVVVDWQKGGNVINLTTFLQDDGGTSPDWGTPTWERRYAGYLSGAIEPYIEPADFVKLREVALNVTVPGDLTESLRLGARDLRIGLVGRNLLQWDDYTGLDPEVANFGPAAVRNNLDIAPYPPSRSFFLTISLGF